LPRAPALRFARIPTASVGSRARASSFSTSSSPAASRFTACERRRWHRSSMPVGPCRRQTVELVLSTDEAQLPRKEAIAVGVSQLLILDTTENRGLIDER